MNRHARRVAEVEIRAELGFTPNKENVAALITDALASGLVTLERRSDLSGAVKEVSRGAVPPEVAYAALLAASRDIASQKALVWLDNLYGPDTVVELSALGAGRTSYSGRLGDPAQRKQMLGFVSEYFGRRNLYAGINPRAPEFAGKKGAAEAADIPERRYAVLDFDNKTARDGDAHAAILAALRVHQPLAEVMSGNGTHLWFELSPGAVVAEATAALNSAMRALGADSIGNPDRIIRLPWTINVPNAGKRKLGLGLALAKVVGELDKTSPVRSVEELIAVWRGHNAASGASAPASASAAAAPASPVDLRAKSKAEVLNALARLPNDAGQDAEFETRNAQVAVAHAVRGAVIGTGFDDADIREAFIDWSAKFGDDADHAGKLYDGVRKPQTGWPHLWVMVLERVPAAGFEAAPVEAAQADQLANIPAALEPGVPDWVAKVNQRYAYLESADRILDLDPDTGQVVKFVSPAEFKTRLGNKWLSRGDKSVAEGEAWLAHPQRRQYTRRGWWPMGQEPTGTLNHWRGFPAGTGLADDPDWTPLPARLPDVLTPTLEFINEVIADTKGNRGNRDQVAEYVLNWLAWKVQNPTSRPGTALALVGASGTGKSTLSAMFADLFGGEHAKPIAKAEQVLGRFNSILEGAMVLCLEEAFFGEDKKIRGVYKDLITNPTINIERKGQDIGAPTKNMAAIIITSNEMSSIPHEPGERRTTFIKVSDVHRRDANYFGRLHRNWTSGGREAFLEFLLKRDVSKFNPGQALSTPEKAEAGAESNDMVVQFWAETLDSGNPFHVLRRNGTAPDWEKEAVFVPVKVLKDNFTAYVKEHGGSMRYEGGQKALLRRLTDLCPGMKPVQPRLEGPNKPGTRGYEFPPLGDCKDAFARAMGGTG